MYTYVWLHQEPYAWRLKLIDIHSIIGVHDFTICRLVVTLSTYCLSTIELESDMDTIPLAI